MPSPTTTLSSLHPLPLLLFLLLPSLALLIIAISRISRIYHNYHFIRQHNPTLPIMVLPVSWQDPLWLILSPQLQWLPRRLPGLFRWVKYSNMIWTHADHAAIHLPPPLGLGRAFAIVSPNRTQFFVIDVDTSVVVSRRWKEFERPADLYKVINVLGRNVVSANGVEWQRMRKVVGAAFRERVYAAVWRESGVEAERLVKGWLPKNDGGIHGNAGGSGESKATRMVGLGKMKRDVEVLAMNVLGTVGFGKGFEAEEEQQGDHDNDGGRQDGAVGLEKVEKGHQMSYMECMRTIMPNLIGVVLVGGLEMVIPEWLFPRSLRRVKLAVKEYRLYLADAVRREQKRASTELEKVPSLSTLLVRANDLEKDVNLASGTKTGYLSDEELFGNMFAFNFAGQETTARTVSFCIPYLASYPEVQDWARKEVDEVFRGGKELSYEEVYEKLPRVRALMYETLRLHAPVAHLPRQSPPQTTLLQVPSMDLTITIPPTSLVSIPAVISGYVPSELNGLDPYIFDPKRFIVTDEKGKDSLLDEAALLKSGYMPFMTGPRICPGKKFSQVEFARVLSSVLFSGEVRPAKVQGFSGSETAEDQLRSVMRDTVINRGLSISNVDQYAVDFVPR